MPAPSSVTRNGSLSSASPDLMPTPRLASQSEWMRSASIAPKAGRIETGKGREVVGGLALLAEGDASIRVVAPGWVV